MTSKNHIYVKLREIEERNRRALVRRFGAKARCAHSQRVALRLWDEVVNSGVRPQILSKLWVAWTHVRSDEGPAELDALVRELTGPVDLLRGRRG